MLALQISHIATLLAFCGLILFLLTKRNLSKDASTTTHFLVGEFSMLAAIQGLVLGSLQQTGINQLAVILFVLTASVSFALAAFREKQNSEPDDR